MRTKPKPAKIDESIMQNQPITPSITRDPSDVLGGREQAGSDFRKAIAKMLREGAQHGI